MQVPSPQGEVVCIFCLLFSCSQNCPIFRLNSCMKKKKSGHLAIVNRLELLLLWIFNDNKINCCKVVYASFVGKYHFYLKMLFAHVWCKNAVQTWMSLFLVDTNIKWWLIPWDTLVCFLLTQNVYLTCESVLLWVSECLSVLQSSTFLYGIPSGRDSACCVVIFLLRSLILILCSFPKKWCVSTVQMMLISQGWELRVGIVILCVCVQQLMI